MHDTTDVGRLTSPSFSQEREVSAIPLSVPSSQTHLSVARPMRDVEPFSSIGKPVREVEPFLRFEKPLSKCKRKSITGECKFLKCKGKEFWPNRNIRDFLEQKAEQTFQGELAAQTRLSEAQAESEENGKGEMLILLSMKLAFSLNPRGWNSCGQINCLFRLKGRRAG